MDVIITRRSTVYILSDDLLHTLKIMGGDAFKLLSGKDNPLLIWRCSYFILDTDSASSMVLSLSTRRMIVFPVKFLIYSSMLPARKSPYVELVVEGEIVSMVQSLIIAYLNITITVYGRRRVPLEWLEL